MDYPFSSSKETVRVRCGADRPWQIYLRLLPSAAPAGQAAQAAAGPGLPAPPPAAPSTVAVATKPALVARRLIQRGTVLGPDMVELVQRPAKGLDPLTMSSLQDVEQGEAIRDIPAGTVLRSYDIKRSLMVKKGQTALLSIGQAPGFQVSVRVEAQQDGHMGEQIRLKNTESGRLLSGVVTGPNAVRGIQIP
jgi:flagella basal body P-ring formation protein FlgA